MADHRLQALAVGRFGLPLATEHARDTGAINIRVEDADYGALGLQCERKINRGGRLADPALARRDRDDVLDPP